MNDIALLHAKWPFLLIATAVLLLSHVIITIVYRLYFHPLASLPGPKYAAVSYAHEFYWDVVQRGQFFKKLRQMHEQYGPIVRFNPDEVHIYDADMYEEIYWQKWGKYIPAARSIGLQGSTAATVDLNVHKRRRAVITPFFSKTSIANRGAVLEGKVEKLCVRFREAFWRGQVIELRAAYIAMTTDIITLFLFGESYDYLDLPAFAETFKHNIQAAFEGFLLGRHFPVLVDVLKLLPLWFLAIVFPPAAGLLEIRHKVTKRIVQNLDERKNASTRKSKGKYDTTIFDEILDNDTLPPSEREIERLTDEGQSFINGGSETTGRALSVGTAHLLLPHNGLMRARLLAELKTVMPTPNSPIPPYTQLETLPYLTGVVKECMRLQCGTLSRLQRVSTGPWQYREWAIPQGTPLSCSPGDVLSDDRVFPSPDVFCPERWLLTIDDEPVSTWAVDIGKVKFNKVLDKYMVAFGKGLQQCVGMWLAYAEVYVAIAMVFRRFEMELFETDESDVKAEHDFFTGFAKVDTKGVRVRIKGMAED